MLTPDFTSVSFLAATTCGLLAAIQMLYAFCLYARVFRHSRRHAGGGTPALPPLSVVIVTKDSGSLLEKNLPFILEQDYPQFEVIVVNDKSAGEDEDILKRLSARYANLYHTFIPETARYVSRKKLGIAMGIRAARHEWIVTTEPYCRPQSREWLRSLAEQMDPAAEIVLGYSNYLPEKGWFARRIRLDMFLHSLRYLSMALAGKPYKGVGCNLAYRKAAYQRSKGFANHLQLQRGEDDLLVNAMATRTNTRVAAGEESIVRIGVPPSKRMWNDGKMNSMATARHYCGTARLFNGIETGTCALFHLAAITALATSLAKGQWILAGAAFLFWAVRFISVMLVFRRAAKALQENFCCVLPLFDLLRPLESLRQQMLYCFRAKNDFLRK